MIPIALQLYTVRDETARDMAGTLAQVAAMGYAGVELTGYGGMTVNDLRARLDTLGLRVAGSHVAVARLEGELPQVFAECHTLGVTHLVWPFLPIDQRTVAGFTALAESLNRVGTAGRAEGITLCYHNHAFEWETTNDGMAAYDWLAGMTDPEAVQLELDVYWLLKAGHDPAMYLERYAGRVPLVHLKDITKDERETFAPVGEGSVDFTPIFAAAEQAGTAWYIVEQDRADGSSIEAARTSLNNLRALGKA
jgi:sugar phosphate isomerase/epimerase